VPFDSCNERPVLTLPRARVTGSEKVGICRGALYSIMEGERFVLIKEDPGDGVDCELIRWQIQVIFLSTSCAKGKN
jgi:hypothetical protein